MWSALRRRPGRVLEPAPGLRRSSRDLQALVGLCFVLVAAVAVSAVLTQLGSLKRTAEAPVTVTSAIFEPGGGTKDRREQGFHLQYVYVVGTSSYPAMVFRTWASVEERQPKVCYDPANPADHLLVDGSVDCGVGAMFR